MAYNPVNILDEMIQKAQQVQGVPAAPPQRYMTPGMSGYTMSSSGTPQLPQQKSSGPGIPMRQPHAPENAAPLPTPRQVVAGGLTFGPQKNQGMPTMSSGPLGKTRPRQSEDPRRRRRQIGR